MESQKPGNEANSGPSVEASCNRVEQSVNQLQRSHVEKYILSTVEAQTLMKTPEVFVLVHTMMLLNSPAETGLIVLVNGGYMKCAEDHRLDDNRKDGFYLYCLDLMDKMYGCIVTSSL